MENQTPEPTSSEQQNPVPPPPVPVHHQAGKVVATIVVLIILLVATGLWFKKNFKSPKQAQVPANIAAVKQQEQPKPTVDLNLSVINVPDADNAFFDLNNIKSAGLNSSTSDFTEIKLEDEFSIIRGQSFDATVINKLIADNQIGLDKFEKATQKNYFQVPAYSDPAKISLNIPLYPMNSWRAAARVYLIKAINLAHQEQPEQGLNLAENTLKLGHNIQQSQGGIILYLVGTAIKLQSIEAMQTILPYLQSIPNIKAVSDALGKYQKNREGLARDFKFEYAHQIKGVEFEAKNYLQDIKEVENSPDADPELKQIFSYWKNNPKAFNEEETKQYVTAHFTQLVDKINQPCSDLKTMAFPPLLPADKSQYLNTENLVGKWMLTQVELENFDSIFGKACQDEVGLRATQLLLAFHAYKLEHGGNLPDNLNDLVPNYLASLPLDPFTDKNFIYNHDKKVIYSLGTNKTDEGGNLPDVGKDWPVMPDYSFAIK